MPAQRSVTNLASAKICHFCQLSRFDKEMFQFALRRGVETGVPKTFLTRLSLFTRQPELANVGRYAIKSEVDPDVFALFMTRVWGEKSGTVTSENAEQLRDLCDELGFTGCDDEIRAVLGRSHSKARKELVSVRARVDRHDLLLEKLERRVMELERQLQEVRAVPQRVEAAERRLAEIQRKDVSEDVERLKTEVMERASAADVMSLSEEVSRLKAEMRSTATSQQGSDAPKQAGVPFVYNSSKPLSGIIAHLTHEYGGNVHKMGAVSVSASSTGQSWCGRAPQWPENVAELGTNEAFRSENESGSWILYDFKKWRVAPTSYSIRSHSGWYPKSWVLEVSTDGSDGSWQVVDRRDNNESLKGEHVICHFATNGPPRGGFRFVRLRQTGTNHSGSDVLALTSLEVFGTLYSQ